MFISATGQRDSPVRGLFQLARADSLHTCSGRLRFDNSFVTWTQDLLFTVECGPRHAMETSQDRHPN